MWNVFSIIGDPILSFSAWISLSANTGRRSVLSRTCFPSGFPIWAKLYDSCGSPLNGNNTTERNEVLHLHHLNPGCSASILPCRIESPSSLQQLNPQLKISIIIYGNHPWSYEKVSETPSEFLTLIFKISDLRSIKERPLSWRSSYRLSTAHLRRQIQVGEGDANSKSHHYWYTTILFFPRSKYDTPPTHNGMRPPVNHH